MAARTRLGPCARSKRWRASGFTIFGSEQPAEVMLPNSDAVGVALRMDRHALVLGLAACLAACVEAPMRPMPFEPSGPPKGLPLSASDTVVVFVLQAAGPPVVPGSANYTSHPISQPGSVSREFTAAFRTVRPDANVVEADAALREACFGGTPMVVDPAGVLLAMPELTSDSCRALVEARQIAYLVTVGGRRETATVNSVEVPGAGIVATSVHTHVFRLLARAVETTGGTTACEETHHAGGRSAEGFVTVYFIFPIPMATILDEPAYWTSAALHVGRQVGWCFAPPRPRD